MTYGIRILDKENRVVTVELPDVLMEVRDGDSFHWAILFLDSMGDLGEGKSIPVFENMINNSQEGLLINWEDLNVLSKKFYQIFDLILIGCRNKDLILRYQNDQEMHNTCDIVIEMIDSSYWEVFAKDLSFIERLEKKFKQVEWLDRNRK